MAKLNCMGDFCPIPALKVAVSLAQLKTGETLSVLVDHNCAVENIKSIIKGLASNVEIIELTNGIWEVTLVKM
jgi:tRNA 2-thiouridine synthesizing protein A